MEFVSSQLWRTAGIVLCSVLVAGEAAAEICIDVDLRFAGRAPVPITVQTMRDEASAIWQRYGLQIQWPSNRRDVQCPFVHGSFDVLVEDQPPSAGSASRVGVLGSTRLVPAAIDHVGILVDYDETLGLLESLPESQRFTLLNHPDIGPVDVGRALGRVLAHEIGHVVLGAPRHQSWGLMRKRFTPADLADRRRGAYTLSRREVERLALRERELRGYSAAPILPPLRR